jgi:parvulin-like peptidyl-prolyl isomerase
MRKKLKTLNPFHIRRANESALFGGLRRTFLTLLAVVATVVLIGGCAKKTEEEGPSSQLLTVVAQWKGGQMTLGECLHFFRELHSMDEIDPRKLDESLRQLVNEWVAERVLWERAKEDGLDRDPRYLDKIRPLKEEWLVRLMVRKEVEEPIVLDQNALKNYYEENKEEFMIPAQYSYYRIFFSSEIHGEEKAEERAKNAWGSMDKGANFNDILEEYSDTRSEKKYLEYGPFRAGENPAEIEEVIAQTPIGGYSPVVKLPNGFMIISPVRKDEAVVKPFESVRRTIATEFYEEKREEGLESFLQNLADRYQLTPNRDLLKEDSPAPDAVILRIEPGAGAYTWRQFQEYLANSGMQARSDWEKGLEEFAKRMLMLHHARESRFEETQYFRTRFRPVEVRVLSDYLLQRTIDEEIEVTNEEVRAYYEAHPTQFERPARMEIWHIVRNITYPENASEREKIDAGYEVENQLRQIRALIATQGHNFVTYANRFTESNDGGYMGYVTLAAMKPEWVRVAAYLDEGEISDPFRFGDTFEMLMRGGYEAAGVFKYEEIRDKVELAAKEEKRTQERVAEIDRLLTEIGMIFDSRPLADLIGRLAEDLRQPPSYWRDPYR